MIDSLPCSEMALSDRMREAMAGPPKVSQAALARACSVKPPSVNDWLSGKTKTIEGANLLAAAAHLNVNALWLATGKGAREGGVKNGVQEMPTASHIQAMEAAILSRALIWLDFEEKTSGTLAHPLRRAERLIALYQAIQADGGELSPTHAKELIDAASQRSQQGQSTDGKTHKRGDNAG
jgi:transcriptional regulator with XRE-family HTH domain